MSEENIGYLLPDTYTYVSPYYAELLEKLPSLIESKFFNLCRGHLLDTLGNNKPRALTSFYTGHNWNLAISFKECQDRFLKEKGWTDQDVEELRRWEAAGVYVSWDVYRDLGIESDPEYMDLQAQYEAEYKASVKKRNDDFEVEWRIAQEAVMNIINDEIDKLQAEGRALHAEKLTMDYVKEHCHILFR